MKDNFSYEITEHIATLSESGDTAKELNKVSYNGAEPKYDLINKHSKTSQLPQIYISGS